MSYHNLILIHYLMFQYKQIAEQSLKENDYSDGDINYAVTEYTKLHGNFSFFFLFSQSVIYFLTASYFLYPRTTKL